jgi:hypothetical protein
MREMLLFVLYNNYRIAGRFAGALGILVLAAHAALYVIDLALIHR